jgi:F0F1-type ATP synthase membrane subunit b/b'
VQQLAQTFGVDWPHLIAQVVSFSIVCALLYRLAYTPVLAMLARRRELIAQGLVNTEKINAALAAIEVRREQTLSAAREGECTNRKPTKQSLPQIASCCARGHRRPPSVRS